MTNLPRRALFGAAAAIAAYAVPRAAAAQAQPPSGPHRLPELPYAFNANEAAIDARTMELHWRFHHDSYVDKLNAAIRDHSALHGMPLDRLLMNLNQVPESVRTTVRNNAGGHANHSMFWTLMGGRGGEPAGDLAGAVTRDFGDFAALKSRFNAAAGNVFGSGWAFVTVDGAGRLAVAARPDQDTPLMDGQRVLLGNDMWEHAYYLRYQNRSAEYATNWWNVLNWDAIARRYAAARAGTLGV